MKKVMIVEDDKAFALRIAQGLKREYRIKIAYSAEECLRALNSIQPEYILLDYYLPDGNGKDLFLEIRELMPSCKVIVLSGQDSSQTVYDLIKLGIRDYVVKSDDAIDEIKELLLEEE